MGQFGNDVQSAINGVCLQVFKMLHCHRILKICFYRGIVAAEEMRPLAFFQDQKRILSETPHTLEGQSHGTRQLKSSVVRNLGSYIDDKLSMNSHINKVCNASFYYLYNIRRIRKYLSRDSSETLIHAFVSSRLDYCNSLLYGLPQVQIDKIQRVPKCSCKAYF